MGKLSSNKKQIIRDKRLMQTKRSENLFYCMLEFDLKKSKNKF